MMTFLNQPERDEFSQDPVDGAAVELRPDGNGSLRRPAHAEAVGMGAQNEEDGQFEGAHFGIV
jgi:hypothetical protein